MSEQNEKVGPGEGGDDGAAPKEPQEKRVSVRVSLFFDGTGNNRVNTNSRLGNKPDSNPEAYKKFGKKGSSYANDHSNVSRLEEKVLPDKSYDVYIKVYTEGIGTVNYGDDDIVGYATGRSKPWGPATGVFSKVKIGVLQAISEISERVDPHVTIARLTVDTFGFSRGAAAARLCIHQVLHNNPSNRERNLALKTVLGKLARTVEEIDVKLVGLFDTVSALGLPIDISDVAELKLNSVRYADAVLHLAAAEEYRKCFSLTNIASAGGKGKQVFLPGAHSDIGGGYVDGEGEKKLLMTGGACSGIENFLRQGGWYQGDELVYTILSQQHGHIEMLNAHRAVISNEYSFIPLRLMAKWVREQALGVDPRLESEYDPINVPQTLVTRIESYADSKGSGSAASDWQSDEPELRSLRHDFLHVSIAESAGMTMRVKGEGRAAYPTRKVYPG